MTDRETAARARAAEMAQRSFRPRQRRSSDQPGAGGRTAPVLLRSLELRALEDDASTVTFTGVASSTENPYVMHDMFGEYSEVVSRGAFERSLNRADLDVPLVLGHDQMRRIARTTNGTLTLAETDEGLVPTATLDLRDADTAYIVPKLRAGLIDEMSFAFMITAGQWSPDYSEFRINEVDIHRGDVAIVGYGANPNTAAEVRSARRGMSRAKLDLILG
jgi:HK97 family phage prohead protease